ncbi:MAG: hypothetical protein PHH58_17480 [Rhodoferax sp.]|nr:hypothetical protein [Rhodoferax sp.]
MNRPVLIRTLGHALVLTAVWLPVLGCHAQALRDPTRSPVVIQSEAGAVALSKRPMDTGQMALVVRDGVSYLVHDARLYAVGQTVGAARIERLTETEVWLREAGVLNKVQVFQGVDRQASAPAPVPSAAASKQRKVRVTRP